VLHIGALFAIGLLLLDPVGGGDGSIGLSPRGVLAWDMETAERGLLGLRYGRGRGRVAGF